jgi:three-Cys-motif partner protein
MLESLSELARRVHARMASLAAGQRPSAFVGTTLVIYAVCVACGSYLDLDEPICRACGADNSPEAEDEPIELDPALELDRLGEWSLIKHEIITKYAAAYTTILKAQGFRRRVYIDGFAGAGVAIDDATGEYVPGSALRALDVKPEFTEFHFIELDDRKRQLLRRLTEGHPEVQVHRGDCEAVLRNTVLQQCRYEDYARGLCLLDPYGLNVSYELLQTIGQMGTVEIFFNFMLVAANRNVLWRNPSRVSARQRALMTRVWGSDEWTSELYQEQQAYLFGATPEKVSNEVVVEKYRGRLMAAGFKYVPEPIPMRNSTGATLYYLFFASPKKVAGDIVDDIFSKYRV